MGSKNADISTLAGYLNEPVVKNKVIAFMREAGMPMFVREICAGTGLLPRHAGRVITRLVKQGVAERWQVPAGYHVFDRKAWKLVPGGAMRPQYLYQLVEAEDA